MVFLMINISSFNSFYPVCPIGATLSHFFDAESQIVAKGAEVPHLLPIKFNS